ncbi:hypothetical protein HK100_008514, partial [Physocladia obscura]
TNASALRARKQEYILNLEANNRELLLENTRLKQQQQMSENVTSSISCNTNSTLCMPCHNPACIAKMRTLQDQIDILTVSSPNTRSSASTITLSPPTADILVKPSTAEENSSLFSNQGSIEKDGRQLNCETDLNFSDDLFSTIMMPFEDNRFFFDEIWNFGNDISMEKNFENLPVKSAEEIYGPIVLEPYKTQVKALPSVGNAKI